MKAIIGPPGTGKTTRLLAILEEELKTTDPTRVAFCSFTKKAVSEAVDRAIDKFGFAQADMPYFRTLHSLGFSILGLKREDVMQPKDYRGIGRHLGLHFSSKFDPSDAYKAGRNPGDRYAFLHGYARAKCWDTERVWRDLDSHGLNWFEFQRYVRTIDEYKKKFNKVDYSDMLGMCSSPIDVDVVIIDEAQDLSTLQWQFAFNVFANAKRFYLAGDDDQAIFQWSGADVETFQSLSTANNEILTQSHRVPKLVHRFAEQIAGKIKKRTEKRYLPMDKMGAVEYLSEPSHADMSSGTWLLLARNAHYVQELAATVRSKGHVFSIRGESIINKTHLRAIQLWEMQRKGRVLSDDEIGCVTPFLAKGHYPKEKIWHEAFTQMEFDFREFYISLLRRGESLTKTPRINITTIHGAKGGEADHVLLLTDMSQATWEGQKFNMDAEHRVWYVGATRCRESLNIVMPRSRYNYAQ